MIYLNIIWGFLKVGCFAFGGAYGAIPLIRDVVLSYNWLTDEELTYMIAISESTPGPIMVNLTTYVGSTQAGLPGSILATAAVVLPSFLIILLITAIMKAVIKNPYVQAVLMGLKPCITGIILATGLYMVIGHCIFEKSLHIQALLLTIVLGLVMAASQLIFKKKLSPIMLIIISAIAGIFVYGEPTFTDLLAFPTGSCFFLKYNLIPF